MKISIKFAKGVPNSLFTVNSWVTGDRMLSAQTTARLSDEMTLDTGNGSIDGVVECIVQLCKQEIRSLLADRDRQLFNRQAPRFLQDESLDLLSEMAIDLDAKLVHF